jgi:hypothetical protein
MREEVGTAGGTEADAAGAATRAGPRPPRPALCPSRPAAAGATAATAAAAPGPASRRILAVGDSNRTELLAALRPGLANPPRMTWGWEGYEEGVVGTPPSNGWTPAPSAAAAGPPRDPADAVATGPLTSAYAPASAAAGSAAGKENEWGKNAGVRVFCRKRLSTRRGRGARAPDAPALRGVERPVGALRPGVANASARAAGALPLPRVMLPLRCIRNKRGYQHRVWASEVAPARSRRTEAPTVRP